jgi:phenylacetate-CoA ligase
MAGYKRVHQRYDNKLAVRRCFYRKAGYWPLEKVKKYQLERLKYLAKYAYANVPYYRRLFDNIHLSPKDIQTYDDWKKIPLLTKEDVRNAGKDLISREYKLNDLIVSSTGGSSGIPLVVYHDHEAMAKIYASFWEYHRPGVEPQDSYATFQGLLIIPPTQRGGPYWRMNKAMNQRLYSIFHMTQDTIRDYIEDLDRFKPVYLSGYSNSLYLLAKLAQESRIIPRHIPKAVFTTSEQLFRYQREVIQEVFRTKVWDAYSQDETCGSISEYECGYYHYDSMYGYMEFFDINHQYSNSRHLAEIVCTGFFNKAWPLLRYRIGDLVEYENVDICPKCGRIGPVIHEIQGRTRDMILTPSGRHIPSVSGVWGKLHGIRQMQIIQENIAQIIINYVPAADFRPSIDEKILRDSFLDFLGEPIECLIIKVNEITKTPAGKYVNIISKIGRIS